jgi:outer membrane lipoprotein LolB
VKWRPTGRLPALLLLITGLAGCAAPPVRDTVDPLQAYRERAERVGAWNEWSLTARLGISAGEDGGSGRLDWDQGGARSDLRFRGTLGQGAWRLQSEPGTATLEQADGSVRRADDVESLVREATGWSVPVTALGWWVRGLAWPGAVADGDPSLNEDGTLRSLAQAGWTIEYTRWGAGPAGLAMPTRLEAARDDLTVKLAISRWTAGDSEDG